MQDIDFDNFFKSFGGRCRELRQKYGWTQEKMLEFGFGIRHYQRIEGGLPINMKTALRLAKAFDVTLAQLFKGLDC